ncbi:MAG: sulfite exporter TauE/SafE family protein [Desulfobulbaceae bacterium]|uniref:Probable membrane transporter protein n=1 Tax=Candidatus Desulfobia pelagia TaxID=2841692 RepID=A0A8J6NB98_9BACT|nr:sulfite exporter TauE/SafE family protein [Candidatus Desulfobia pelagia]
MSISALLVITIFFISLVLTMVGLGGGLIFSPLFVILGFAKSEAASASLFLNLIAAASAAFTYSRKRMVDFSLSIPLIISSSLAAPIGSYLNVYIDPQPFLVILAIVLAMAGVRMLMPPAGQIERNKIGSYTKIFGGIGIGACIGLMGGLLGIGGGVFIVPLLIYVLKTPTKIAAASSTFIVCFSSLTGFLGYVSIQQINWIFLIPAAIAAFAGGQAGSRIMSTRLKGRSIRLIFSIILFILCAKLLHKAFFG